MSDSSEYENWVYINKETGEAYVWDETQWNVLGTGDLELLWQGELEEVPGAPELHWAYYNTVTRQAYVYDGYKWQILSSGPVGPKGEKGEKGSFLVHSYGSLKELDNDFENIPVGDMATYPVKSNMPTSVLVPKNFLFAVGFGAKQYDYEDETWVDAGLSSGYSLLSNTSQGLFVGSALSVDSPCFMKKFDSLKGKWVDCDFSNVHFPAFDSSMGSGVVETTRGIFAWSYVGWILKLGLDGISWYDACEYPVIFYPGSIFEISAGVFCLCGSSLYKLSAGDQWELWLMPPSLNVITETSQGIFGASSSSAGIIKFNSDLSDWETTNITSNRFNCLVETSRGIFAGSAGTGPSNSCGIYKLNIDTWDWETTNYTVGVCLEIVDTSQGIFAVTGGASSVNRGILQLDENSDWVDTNIIADAHHSLVETSQGIFVGTGTGAPNNGTGILELVDGDWVPTNVTTDSYLDIKEVVLQVYGDRNLVNARIKTEDSYKEILSAVSQESEWEIV